MLEKKFVQIGASWSIIIPKSVLAVLNINPVLDKVSVEIEPDGIKLKKLKREY
jgi:antitoxin component of MazEF toxin-antitoxin module